MRHLNPQERALLYPSTRGDQEHLALALPSSYHARPQSFYPPLRPPLAGDAIFPSDLLILNGACKLRPTVGGLFIAVRGPPRPPMFNAVCVSSPSR